MDDSPESNEQIDTDELDELEADPLAAESEDELEDFDKRRSITQNLTDRVRKDLGAKLDKWHVNNPSIQKEAEKRRKNAERQRVLRAKRKAEKEAANADSEDHSDHEANRHRPAKKARVQAPIEAVEDVEAEMIAYIRIRKDIVQPAASGFRGKGRRPANPNPNDETLFSSRGPIFVPLATPYDSFLAMISKSLPCPVIDIVQNSIQYQAQSPKTSPILPAGSPDAFKAMVMHFTTQSRKKNANLSLFIYMDKPMKSDGPTWDTGEGDLEDLFDFSTVEAFTGSSSVSLSAQKASIDEASKPFLDVLCEKYVTGSNLLYPGIRVYTNTRGESWELNDTRLSTWASHMARRTPGVDDSHPPNTAWFNGKYILRPVTTPAAITTSTPVPAAIPSPASDIRERFMDFAMMSMMHNMSQQAPAVQRTLSMSAIQASSAPASPIRLARISFDEFCSFYGVSETDKGRLTELEYQPGNRAIEQMDKAEWSSVGFKFLSWSNILTVHRKFISDVKSGAWDHIMQV